MDVRCISSPTRGNKTYNPTLESLKFGKTLGSALKARPHFFCPLVGVGLGAAEVVEGVVETGWGVVVGFGVEVGDEGVEEVREEEEGLGMQVAADWSRLRLAMASCPRM